MPVYEYECNGCKKIFEVQQRMADAPLTACPDCGQEVRKLVSMSSFQLKGSGWYNDGYSGCSSAKSSASSDTGTASCPASGGGCCQCPAAH